VGDSPHPMNEFEFVPITTKCDYTWDEECAQHVMVCRICGDPVLHPLDQVEGCCLVCHGEMGLGLPPVPPGLS